MTAQFDNMLVGIKLDACYKFRKQMLCPPTNANNSQKTSTSAKLSLNITVYFAQD